MATPPPMADSMAPQPDPSASPMGEEAAEPTEGGGFEIVIKVAADGSLSVGCESASDEAAEAAPGVAPEGDDSNFTPASDAKAALTLALGYIKSGGKSNGNEAMGKRLQSAGFASGYEED